MNERKDYMAKVFSRRDIIDEIADQSRSNGFDGSTWETSPSERMDDYKWLESRLSFLVQRATQHGKELMQSEMRELLGFTKEEE